MKISIITVTYNALDTVIDTINSVLAQSYSNIEYIVIDGASTDGTKQLLDAKKDFLDVYLSEPDSGIYDALNKGIARSSGDVIGFLHSDDLFANTEVISKVAATFSDLSIDAVYGDMVYVSNLNQNKVIRYWRAGEYVPRKLKSGWMPPHPTYYARRELYHRLGGFDTSFRIAADYDCMLRHLGTEGISCSYIPDVLVKMRLGGVSNRSLKNILRKSAEDYQVIRRNHVGGFGTLTLKNLSKLSQFILRA